MIFRSDLSLTESILSGTASKIVSSVFLIISTPWKGWFLGSRRTCSVKRADQKVPINLNSLTASWGREGGGAPNYVLRDSSSELRLLDSATSVSIPFPFNFLRRLREFPRSRAYGQGEIPLPPPIQPFSHQLYFNHWSHVAGFCFVS